MKAMTILYQLILLTLATTTLCGCNRYDVKLNENIIYSPNTLFTNYALSDNNLSDCVQKTIIEDKIKSKTQLVRLFCPDNKIERLDGLELFSNLRQIDISGNLIRDISVLGNFKKLTHLNLKNNSLISIKPISRVNSLIYLDLSENPRLNCQEIEGLTLTENVEISLPQHCAF